MADGSDRVERRQYPRSEGEFAVIFNLAMPIPVNMDTGAEEYAAVALDVSEGGIGLDVDRAVAAETQVKLHFELINSKSDIEQMRRATFKLEGEVRYCVPLKKNHFHIGVQFRQLNPEQREFILTYIKDLALQQSRIASRK